MKEYHLKGTSRDDPDNWLTKVQLDFEGLQIGVHTDDERTIGEGTAAAIPADAGPKSEYWDYWSGGESWPPLESVKTGEDRFGEAIYEKKPNWKLIREYNTWLRGEYEKAQEKQAKEQEKAAKEQASQDRMSAEPRFYQDPETGQRYIQNANGDWEVDEAASESIAQQQALQPKRPSSLVGLMAEALDSGNIEQARGLWEFENQITPLQYLQLTLEYADNPEALKVLFDFVQARRPGIIGGQGQGPVSGQPSQQAGFAPGSYAARSFDLQDPATQQQYLLRQQYIKAGGVPGGSSPFQTSDEATASLSARYPDAPREALMEEALRLTGQAGQPQAALAAPAAAAEPRDVLDRLRGGAGLSPLGTRPVFQAPAAGQQAFGEGPGIEQQLPPMQEPPSVEDDIAGEGYAIQNPAGGRPVDNSTFEGFMSGFKPFADTPGQAADIAKNLAAGNPYAGKVNASNPVTGQWTDWVDQQNGQVFMEIPGGGLSATERFEPIQKPKQPSPFNPVDLEGYLKAAQTLGASKKPRQRSPFTSPPRQIARR